MGRVSVEYRDPFGLWGPGVGERFREFEIVVVVGGEICRFCFLKSKGESYWNWRAVDISLRMDSQANSDRRRGGELSDTGR